MNMLGVIFPSHFLPTNFQARRTMPSSSFVLYWSLSFVDPFKAVQQVLKQPSKMHGRNWQFSWQCSCYLSVQNLMWDGFIDDEILRITDSVKWEKGALQQFFNCLSRGKGKQILPQASHASKAATINTYIWPEKNNIISLIAKFKNWKEITNDLEELNSCDISKLVLLRGGRRFKSK